MITFKLVLIGDPSVGKTSIVSRFAYKRFTTHLCSTIGASFVSYILNIDDNKVRLNIWDTAGQEKFRSMVSMYYRDADYCLIVFDITKYNVDNINYWIDEYLNKTANPNPKFVLVANKCDLNSHLNKDIEKLAKERNISIFKTSAYNGTNVEELFEYIGRILVDMPVEHRLSIHDGTNIKNKNKVENPSKCCYY